MAIEEQNVTELKRAVDDMKALNLATLNTDVEHAESELHFLTIKRGKTNISLKPTIWKLCTVNVLGVLLT